MNKKYPWQKNEEGFLLIMVLLATSGLIWLFWSFLMPVSFAIILTSATYPLFNLIKNKMKLNDSKSAILTTLIIFLIIVAPISYLIIVITNYVSDMYNNNSEFLRNIDINSFLNSNNIIFDKLGISEDSQAYIIGHAKDYISTLITGFKNVVFYISTSIVNNSMGFLVFIAITLFSSYFFYRDGHIIINKIKEITPLHNDYDDLLIKEFSKLSSILTLSVFVVAMIQGISFSLLTYFMNLDWFFIGISIAVTSFIPIVGSIIVWLPLAVYLFLIGNNISAFFVLFWGMFVIGFLIDNIFRPYVTKKICKIFVDKNDFKYNPLDHTLLVIFSTFGGIITFGIIGLFIGPIIAALSIAIFDVYIKRIENLP